MALVEDGRLSEIYIERPDRKSYLGDIYQGKVENVMSGIDAAFVDFGLEKNGFLYVDEVTTPEGEKRARRITRRAQERPAGPGAGHQGPDGAQGRPAEHQDLPRRALPGLRAGRQRRGRVPAAQAGRARAPARHLQAAQAQGRGADHPHHRRGPRPRGPQARHAVPLQALVAPQEEVRDGQAAGSGAQGSGHLARGHPRPLQRHLREPHRRRPQAAQGDPLVPQQGSA